MSDRLLEPEQRQLIDAVVKTQQPVLLRGPAGSGKSLELIHILVKILEDYLARQINAAICVVLFTKSNIDMMKSGIANHLLNRVKFFTTFEFSRKDKQWDLIVVDEAQDISDDILNLVFNRGRKVVLSCDFKQSIFENGCSQDYFDGIQNLEEITLPKIYRMTPNIHHIAKYFNDNRSEFESYELYRQRPNSTIYIMRFSNRQDEFISIWNKVSEYHSNGYETAIIVPYKKLIVDFCNSVLVNEGKPQWSIVFDRFGNEDFGNLNFYLREVHDIPLQVIGGGAGSMRQSDTENLVSIMTYHSAKGLDFRVVFLAGLGNQVKLWSDFDIEKRLFFVGLTRCRQDLWLSYHGDPHVFLQKIIRETKGLDNVAIFRDMTQVESPESNNFDEDSDYF